MQIALWQPTKGDFVIYPRPYGPQIRIIFQEYA